MRQSGHAMKFCKLSSGEKSEKKRKGETRFPLRLSLVVVFTIGERTCLSL
jgi:hypothetical protein